MASELMALLQQQAELAKKISETQQRERATAVTQIRAIAAEYGITGKDLLGVLSGKTKKPPAPPKYKDPATGATWNGNGMRPMWLKRAMDSGKKLETFLINKTAVKPPVKKVVKRA